MNSQVLLNSLLVQGEGTSLAGLGKDTPIELLFYFTVFRRKYYGIKVSKSHAILTMKKTFKKPP